jgi:hypothetical protein
VRATDDPVRYYYASGAVFLDKLYDLPIDEVVPPNIALFGEPSFQVSDPIAFGEDTYCDFRGSFIIRPIVGHGGNGIAFKSLARFLL